MGFCVGLVGADKDFNIPYTPTNIPISNPRSPSNESENHSKPSYIHVGATVTPREPSPVPNSQSRHTSLIARPSLQLQPGDFTVHANPSYEFWFDALEYQVRGNSPSMSNTRPSSSPELINYPELGKTIKQPSVIPFRDSDFTKTIRDWEQEALQYFREPISNPQRSKRTKASFSMTNGSVSSGEPVNISNSNNIPAKNPPSSLFLEGYYLMRECQQIIEKLEVIIDRFDLELESSKPPNAPTRALQSPPSPNIHITRHRAFDPPYPLTPDHLKSSNLEDYYDDEYIPRYQSGSSTNPTEAKRYPPLWGSHTEEEIRGQEQQQQREEAPFFDQDYYDRLSPSTGHISPLTLQIPQRRKEASHIYSPSLSSPTASYKQDSQGDGPLEWLLQTSPSSPRRFCSPSQYLEEGENSPCPERHDEDGNEDASSSDFINSPTSSRQSKGGGDDRWVETSPVTFNHEKWPCTRNSLDRSTTSSSATTSFGKSSSSSLWSSRECILPPLRSAYRRRNPYGFALDAWASNLLNAEYVRKWAEVKRQVWRARKWDFKQGVRSWMKRGTDRKRP